MVTKVVLPLLAAAGLGFAIFSFVQGKQMPPPSRPLIPPPTHPEFRAVAGAGLIEASRENIAIGTHEPGIVTRVDVLDRDGRIIERVKQGDPLFQIDDRAARAELLVRRAALKSAEVQLQRLRAAPRPEDVPPARAAVAEAKAKLKDAEINYLRSSRLRQQNAITDSELDRDRFTYEAAGATLAKAQADLDRLLKGTWEEDIAVAEAAVDSARAQVEAAQTALDRLTVRAPIDGRVLQVNVRPGQFAGLVWKEPLIVLGDLTHLHVRVDIDEQDLPLFSPGARAIATLKGRPNVRFDLEFFRVEPYVIPKRSLTGDNSERVDTRVLQVIYRLPDERPIPLYVGQQMDVYVEATRTPKGVSLDSGPELHDPFATAPPPATPTRATTPAAR